MTRKTSKIEHTWKTQSGEVKSKVYEYPARITVTLSSEEPLLKFAMKEMQELGLPCLAHYFRLLLSNRKAEKEKP